MADERSGGKASRPKWKKSRLRGGFFATIKATESLPNKLCPCAPRRFSREHEGFFKDGASAHGDELSNPSRLLPVETTSSTMPTFFRAEALRRA